MVYDQYNLNELLISLSNAMDLANPVLMQHQLRTAYISACISDETKMSHQRKDKLFLAAILHDIGAITTTEKISLHEIETKDAIKHCEVGYHIYNQVSWLASASEIIRYHHTFYTDFQLPLDEGIVLEAQILHLSDLLERLIDKDIFILLQKEALINQIKKMSHDLFHEKVIDYFLKASKSDKFWLDVTSPVLDQILSNQFNKRSVYLTLDEMKSVSLVFKSIIDFRSPFTATHSTGVAACASKIASYFNFSDKEISMMEVAGYLHDIGKLAIPNELLEKPSTLDYEEYQFMKQHAYQSYQILSKIGGLEQITEWAVMHHEKLNGNGYPFSIEGNNISLGSRIFAVADVYTALSEDRPYRNAMEADEVKILLKSFVATKHLDPLVVKTLLKHQEDINVYLKHEKEKAKRAYEEFIHLYDETPIE